MNHPDNMTFLIAGVLIALAIGIVAVFFASGDPDGLESTSLVVQNAKTLTGPAPEDGDPEAVGTGVSVYSSPFPDYSVHEESGPVGGIIAIILGIFITFGIVFGLSKAISIRKS